MKMNFTKSNSSLKKKIEIKFILDINELNKVIGIEVINLKLLTNPRILDLLNNTNNKFSYDDDCDAFYLNIDNGRSLKQKTTIGKLYLDNEGRMIALEW